MLVETQDYKIIYCPTVEYAIKKYKQNK